MTLPKMDLSDVEAWEGGEILPPGHHDVEVTSAEEGSSSSGNPQLQLELRAFGGEFDGGTIRDWIVFTPATAGKVKQILLAFGMSADGEVEVSADDFVGKRATILVREETYDGKTRSKVKAYEQLSEVPADTSGMNGGGEAKKDDENLPF